MEILWIISLILLSRTVVGTVSNRVYNGDFAVPGQFPYFASIRMSNGDVCGGSLVSKRSVLTAAHCLQIKDNAGNIKDLAPLVQEVLIGCITPAEVTGTRYCQKRRISSVYIHPDWDGKLSRESADVAIISLDEPVTRIEPVTIAQSATPGESAEVIGFGQSESKTSGKILTYARQRIQSIDGLYLITVPDTAGPCYGDSGGPLVTRKGLVGIVSYGTGLCDSLNDED